MEGDLYYIEARLKEIDPDYFLVRSKGRIEVHNASQPHTFAFGVPYGALDARTLTLARRSRAERAAEYLLETERENGRREAERLAGAVARAERAAETALRRHV